MKHAYNTYTKEELLRSPKIEILLMEDNHTVFQDIAREMIEEIRRKNERKEPAVFICPVGPVGQYPYFVEEINRERISLKNTYFINMDEYLDEDQKWIDKEDKLSFRGFMEREVYAKIDRELLMPEEQRIFPHPERTEEIAALIEKLGGVDICFGGIGINGHVAFNEAEPELTAEEFLNLKTRVLEISRETRVSNAIMELHGAIEDMPRYCVTIGMREIAGAKKIRLACFRDWHRAVVRRAAHGEASAAFPVSLLQNHSDINIRITRFVADLGVN
ncbi:MAG: glucosamine-6-phosphate isomerase [Johnsonella sp.]|nr:glucosamine-6-phosphate isomerase [Johnsonella sp.]